MAEKLSNEERAAALQVLQTSGWAHEAGRDALSKSFKFKDFITAWAWMSAVAMVSEKMNHHPEWSNIYNRVEVTLTTHDANGLTQLDLDLARKMDAIARG